MPILQVVRGTAALPPDIEEQFRRAYGREMNEEERKFYGLESQSGIQQLQQRVPKAA